MKEYKVDDLKIVEKPCSKDKLNVLSRKERQLKEFWMEIVMATKSSNKEVIRVSAWFINTFKNLR